MTDKLLSNFAAAKENLVSHMIQGDNIIVSKIMSYSFGRLMILNIYPSPIRVYCWIEF